MDLPVLAPPWAVATFVGLLLLAALQDVLQRRISNLLCAGLLLLALVVMVLRPDWSLWQNLLGFAVALAIGTWMFSTGVVGGGDAKLFAVTILWFDVASAARLLVAVTALGGILALFSIIIGMRRRRRQSGKYEANTVERASVPYGVAIAGGALLTLLLGH